ncbi:MAG: trehalose-phosphatase [Aquabacterium sp.]
MKHILGNEGRSALAVLLHAPALLAFDFDGTLAPIVADPTSARTPLPIVRALRTLSEHHLLAVITGRTVVDVQQRLGFEPWAVVGNHGAEDPACPPGELPLPTELDGVRQALGAAAGRQLAQAGVMVEDKGTSMALHYRLARDREGARQAAWHFVAPMREALDVFEGKMVLNLMPRGAPDKGCALQRLAARAPSRQVLFVGDDVNDEPAFHQARPDWVTIKVGRDARSAARFFLDATAEVATLLDVCVRLTQEAGTKKMASP